MMAHPDAAPPESHLHLPSLAAALVVMLVSTLYPPLYLKAAGAVDHGLAAALFAAMSAGFVRGVGFVPVLPVWRWVFSGWSCLAALALAGWLKFLH